MESNVMNRMKNFLKDLHEDESGPNTVEWVLLIIIALVLIVLLWAFASWVKEQFDEKQKTVVEDDYVK